MDIDTTTAPTQTRVPVMIDQASILETSNADKDAETKELMKNYIADSTQGSYANRQVNFLLWVFDLYQQSTNLGVLKESTVERMKEADAEDKARRTRAGRPSKKRTSLRNLIKHLLQQVDSEDEDTIFIRLDKLAFKQFTRYLARFKKVIHSRKEKDNNATGPPTNIGEQNGEDPILVRMSTSTYEGECAALANLFKKTGCKREEIMWNKLSQYKKGCRRAIANEKQELGLRLSEGKKVLSFRGYKKMAMKLFESGKKEHIAAHLFLILDWNLIARAENCIGAQINHISFLRDALLFEFGKSKTDQEGGKHTDHPWHVYANPLVPEICPVLALARYLLAHPNVLKGNCKLFEGVSQYERFSNIFTDIIKSNETEFASIGITAGDFGTHSIRKGAATFVATGTTVAPPMASICLRANWTLGGG
jgi:hypothetical protein